MGIELVTFDTVKKYSSTVLSNNNTTVSVNSTLGSAISTKGVTKGKLYCEFYSTGNGTFSIGIVDSTFNPINPSSTPLYSNGAVRMYTPNGRLKYTPSNAYGTLSSAGDSYSMLVDLDNGTLEFYKNGVSQGVAFTDLSTMKPPFYVLVANSEGYAATPVTANFGNSTFKYPIPNGYQPFALTPFNKILLLQNEKTYSIKKGGYTDNIVPKLTSATSNPPIVVTHSHANSGYEGWKLFDGVVNIASSSWIGNGAGLPNATTPYIVTIDFGSMKKVAKYTITTYMTDYATSSPKDFTFEGSNDNFSTFDVLDTKVMTASDWKGNNTAIEFPIDNEKSYRYYRIKITSNLSGNYTRLAELTLHEKINDDVIVIPSHSEQNFIKYGIDSPVKVDVLFKNKNYILQDTVSENAEGLWTTQINRKPLSIKFN